MTEYMGIQQNISAGSTPSQNAVLHIRCQQKLTKVSGQTAMLLQYDYIQVIFEHDLYGKFNKTYMGFSMCAEQLIAAHYKVCARSSLLQHTIRYVRGAAYCSTL